MSEKEDKETRIPLGRVLTLAEAAEILHVSRVTVHRLVTDGELEGFRIRDAWRTSEGAVARYVARQFRLKAIKCKTPEDK